MHISVLYAKQRLEINIAPSDSLCAVRRKLENQLELADGGLVLLYKGKALSDQVTVRAAGIEDGKKIMAMRSRKQHVADKEREKEQKLTSGVKKPVSGNGSSSSFRTFAQIAPVKLGDPEIAGESFIVVHERRRRIRLNLPLTATVREVKERLSSIAELGIENSAFRLIARGKLISDDNMTLSACSLKNGGVMMAVFTAEHYERQEALREMNRLEHEVERIEEDWTSLNKRAKNRLIDAEELILARSQLTENLSLIRDNIQGIRGEDERGVALVKRLNDINKALPDL